VILWYNDCVAKEVTMVKLDLGLSSFLLGLGIAIVVFLVAIETYYPNGINGLVQLLGGL
jgi:hypothetical protein